MPNTPHERPQQAEDLPEELLRRLQELRKKNRAFEQWLEKEVRVPFDRLIIPYRAIKA